MTEKIDRPAFVLDDYLEYLNELRESSETNMQKKTKEDVICPECGATFPESYRKQRCSECGHPLVILEQRDPITAAKAEADLKREMGE